MSVIRPLNLPKASLKIERNGRLLLVWCVVRRKKLVLTPEEWVRQHLIHYLISTVEIPIERIVSEYSISVNGLSRRCDIVVIDKNGNPKMIVECKAPQIKINENTVLQIAQYNRKLAVDYLMLSNGLEHWIFKIDARQERLTTLNELRAEWFD